MQSGYCRGNSLPRDHPWINSGLFWDHCRCLFFLDFSDFTQEMQHRDCNSFESGLINFQLSNVIGWIDVEMWKCHKLFICSAATECFFWSKKVNATYSVACFYLMLQLIVILITWGTTQSVSNTVYSTSVDEVSKTIWVCMWLCVCMCVSVCGDMHYLCCRNINLFAQSHWGDLSSFWEEKQNLHNINH